LYGALCIGDSVYSLNKISSLTGLKKLYYPPCDEREIIDLTKLTNLTINILSAASLNFLTNLTRLETLNFPESDKYTPHLTKLKELLLTRISRSDDLVRKLTNLKKLKTTFCDFVNDTQFNEIEYHYSRH
jgi:hypothetical protein